MKNFYSRMLARAFHFILKLWYPDREHRAEGLLAEGAELFNILQFERGDPFESVEVKSHPEVGYLINVRTASDRREE